MDWSMVDTADIPLSAVPILNIIGLQDTISLLKKWKGKRLYIPKHKLSNHPITIEIGLEKAQKLSKEFGGVTFRFPTCSHLMAAVRNKIIKKEAQQRTTKEIAKEYNITQAHVFYIIRGNG